jgi:hypothetical protein
MTYETGLFAAPVRVGLYDIVFQDTRLPGGTYAIRNVDAWEENVDVGEHRIDK